MAPISAQRLLGVWEQGQGLHDVDQALVMLAAAQPAEASTDLASLSLGERDSRLLALRQEAFGPELEALVQCPRCGEQLEFALSVSDLKVAPPGKQVLELEWHGTRLAFRPLNSYDLAAITTCNDADEARLLLARRCLTGSDDLDLPTELVEDLAGRLAECDPQAEILLDLACPSCRHIWQLPFDIVSFFWREISAEAVRLLREVHTLARTYGWREADILGMSAARRHLYLAMVT